jgi:hypothetical protein
MFTHLVRARRCFTLCALLGILIAARADAQGSLVLDPSVISAGMGGASSAVPWTAEPNYWANPALLGYYDGVRWQWGRTQLIPDLSENVHFTTNRVTLGYGGLGIESAGSPVGGLRLDFGSSFGTDPSGNPTGPIEAFENTEALGFGVSVANLASSILALSGSELPEIVRHFDVALGYANKRTEVELAPGFSESTTAHDRGVLLRGQVGGAVGPGGTGVRFDASYSRAELSYDQQINSPRMNRDGVALRFAVEHPLASASTGTWFHRSLMQAMQPVVALGYAYDNEEVAPGFFGGYTVKHHGAELTMLNVLSLRFGHVQDRTGGIDGATFGFGVALPIGDFAGARYDFAQYPESSDLKDLRRHSFSIFVNPLAMRREMR